jgi:hypothetical protein
VTETSKVVDVLLLLGGKQHSYAQGHMVCLHYTLCLMQLSVVRNLILMGCSDDILVSGLLVINLIPMGVIDFHFVGNVAEVPC